MARLSIVVPDETKAQLKVLAVKKGITLSSLIKFIICMHLEGLELVKKQ